MYLSFLTNSIFKYKFDSKIKTIILNVTNYNLHLCSINKNTISTAMLTLNCKGKLLNLENPLVMGIINATPDSFYEGHLHQSHSEIIGLAEKMINDGASILDIGGQSTRPGSIRISESEETDRVIPVVEIIHNHFPDVIISIDTYFSKVAQSAVSAGASMVNDISSGSLDSNMIPVVATLNVPYVCMHMQGSPETMQKNPFYNNIIKELLEYFILKIEECKLAGIKDIIIDPGFGFGKTIEQNYLLLKELSTFNMLECPILAGLSRKGMIYKSLHTTPDFALNGTTTLNTLALNNGAQLLRVHDVKEAMEAVTLFSLYKNAAL